MVRRLWHVLHSLFLFFSQMVTVKMTDWRHDNFCLSDTKGLFWRYFILISLPHESTLFSFFHFIVWVKGPSSSSSSSSYSSSSFLVDMREKCNLLHFVEWSMSTGTVVISLQLFDVLVCSSKTFDICDEGWMTEEKETSFTRIWSLRKKKCITYVMGTFLSQQISQQTCVCLGMCACVTNQRLEEEGVTR